MISGTCIFPENACHARVLRTCRTISVDSVRSNCKLVTASGYSCVLPRVSIVRSFHAPHLVFMCVHVFCGTMRVSSFVSDVMIGGRRVIEYSHEQYPLIRGYLPYSTHWNQSHMCCRFYQCGHLPLNRPAIRTGLLMHVIRS